MGGQKPFLAEHGAVRRLSSLKCARSMLMLQRESTSRADGATDLWHHSTAQLPGTNNTSTRAVGMVCKSWRLLLLQSPIAMGNEKHGPLPPWGVLARKHDRYVTPCIRQLAAVLMRDVRLLLDH